MSTKQFNRLFAGVARCTLPLLIASVLLPASAHASNAYTVNSNAYVANENDNTVSVILPVVLCLRITFLAP